MKNTVKYAIIFLVTLLTLSACDYVRNAVDKRPGRKNGNRKILVEDYTGHKCGNCPAAAKVLKELIHDYPSKVIGIAVHAGFYANINSQYPEDFRTPEGTAWDALFIGTAGYPNGLINRISTGGSYAKQHTSWTNEVYRLDSLDSPFKLRWQVFTYDTASRSLSISVVAKAVEKITGTYNLCVVVTEDSLYGTQLDYSLPSGQQIIPNYLFMHVLRGSLNSAWGTQIFNGTIQEDDENGVNINATLNANFNAKNCHVVAFLYDAATTSPTRYEVLQAEERDIIPH